VGFCLPLRVVFAEEQVKLPTITQLVKSRIETYFVRCENRTLWYRQKYWVDGQIEDFEFPVHVVDTDGATFLAEDKPIFFMKWMRKHLAFLQQSIDAATFVVNGGPPPAESPTLPARPPVSGDK
jgi:hypothetical protein